MNSPLTAIVDGSRARRGPRSRLVALCCFGALALIAALAAQQPEPKSAAPARNAKPWFDARLRAFFAAKAAQARQFAAQTNEPAPPDVWRYFAAGAKGDWQTTTNLWLAMHGRSGQYAVLVTNDTLCKVWTPILETELAWEHFANGKEKHVLAYGNDIIKSIPPGSIYFGGNDAGRGVITALSKSHADGKPFFTLSQNALTDAAYLEYLRAMYGPTLYIPTGEDSQKSFQDYLADAQRRLAEQKLKPGEDVQMKDNRLTVNGHVAVMSVNALLARIIFDRNPDREFYVVESFPLDWMYPHLSPNGLIMRINREPLAELSDEIVQPNHDYWTRQLQPMLGDWLNDSTSVAEVAAFVDKVYLQHDLGGFTGDPLFIQDAWAQKAYSKLRGAIGGVYVWRATNAQSPGEKQRMTQAADFAFRQAYALCPNSPEALFRYVALLVSSGRTDEARRLAEISLKLDPKNTVVEGLLKNLPSYKTQK
jgi:hypothetical protein